MKPTYFAAISLLLACGSSTSDTAPTLDVEALAQRHDDAWNHHDPGEMTALFADDATVVTPSGRRVEGRAELRALFSAPSPTNQTSSTTRFVGIQHLSSELVLLDGVQTLRGPGTEAVGAEARILAVAARRDGRWQIVAARPYVPASPM
jgi:uncharacterized protein (TIGR02246 family)